LTLSLGAEYANHPTPPTDPHTGSSSSPRGHSQTGPNVFGRQSADAELLDYPLGLHRYPRRNLRPAVTTKSSQFPAAPCGCSATRSLQLQPQSTDKEMSGAAFVAIALPRLPSPRGIKTWRGYSVRARGKNRSTSRGQLSSWARPRPCPSLVGTIDPSTIPRPTKRIVDRSTHLSAEQERRNRPGIHRRSPIARPPSPAVSAWRHSERALIGVDERGTPANGNATHQHRRTHC